MVSSEWRMVGCKLFHSLLAIRYSPLPYHFSPNGLISSSKVQALRGCW